MITVKLGELKAIVEGLNEISQERLPVKVAYALNKATKQIMKELGEFEESRMKLVNTFAMKDEKGNPIIENQNYKLADEQGFAKEFVELANIDVELNAYPVKVSQLGDDIKANIVTLMKLEKFIIDDTEEPKPSTEPVVLSMVKN